MRSLLLAIILAISADLTLPAQTEPSFIAVSIKPNPAPVNTSQTHQITEGRVHFVHVALKTIILDAFRIPEYRLFSQASLTSGRWDVEATMPTDASPAQIASMLRTMLKERFALRAHFEKKVIPVYSLTTEQGNKLQPLTEPATRLSLGDGPASIFRITGKSKMDAFAKLLQETLDYPVLDRTGLDGVYQINIDYARNDNIAAPSLFTVLRNQLGLKLDLKKEEFDCLVIDSFSPTPTPN